MKIILADDFTGASDSAIKFKESNIDSKVIWDTDIKPYFMGESLVALDLDSRNLSGKDAYNKVKIILEQLKEVDNNKIFKKIDSTLRGNIGVEIDAILDSGITKFIVVVPSYPDNQRLVKNGNLYIGSMLLESSYFFKDVEYKGVSSSVKDIISSTSKYKVGYINKEEIQKGLKEKISNELNNDIKIFICDAETNNDISQIYKKFNDLNEDFIWCGSAGLASCIAKSLKTVKSQYKDQIHSYNESVIVSIGTTNNITRKQLNMLLKKTEIIGIEVKPYKLLHTSNASKEIKKIKNIIIKYLKDKKDIALFTNLSEEENEKLIKYRTLHKLNSRELGEKISNGLGLILEEVDKSYKVKTLIMSGGDTAKSIAQNLGYKEYHLIESIEEGMPMGFLKSENHKILSVTKAGGFGTEISLINAYLKLGGHLKNEYNRNSSSNDYTLEKEPGN